MMRHSALIITLLFMLDMVTVCSASSVEAIITFHNSTNTQVVETQKPYLDNYNYAVKADENYHFKNPDNTIEPQQSTEASASYKWEDKEYGASQYAYNYSGRSPEYGCFVTELRLSGHFYNWYNSNIVIASYRQDPLYPNDYLACTVEHDPRDRTKFIVNLISTTQDSDKVESDAKRFSIAGDSEKITLLTDYKINLPIQLNPTLALLPNNTEPVLMTVAPTTPDFKQTLTIVNHTHKKLLAALPKLTSGNWAKFNNQYFLNYAKEINPLTTQQNAVQYAFPVSTSTSHTADNPIIQFDYFIEGDNDNVCSIETKFEVIPAPHDWTSPKIYRHITANPTKIAHGMDCFARNVNGVDQVDIYEDFL